MEVRPGLKKRKRGGTSAGSDEMYVWL